MNKNKILITGGAGFIGSNLARELVTNNQVTIIDNLFTGRKENIADLIDKGSAKFIEGSITDTNLLNRAFRGVDYVFHQAAIPSVPRSVKDPLASNNANITGTLNVLIAARDNGIKKVAYASSSSVYGDTPVLPKREDMKPNPLSPYAITKLAGEYYCLVFHQVYGLPTVALRYFNVYGPRQDPNSQYAAVIPKFITSILEDKPPTVFGDGTQSRDFTFVKDVVQANILAAESNATGAINIGAGQQNTIDRLAQIINKIIGRNLTPIHEEPLTGDAKHSLADISKAKEIGYEPKYDLERGLHETIRWFSAAT